MTKLHQRTELIANVLIIIVALALGGALIQKYFFPSQPKEQARLTPEIGSRMTGLDVNWPEKQKTLVLALQANCGYCNSSAPFYKRIIENVQDKNVRLVAVFPANVEESAAHLQKLGLMNMEVKQSSLGGLKVSGTPTLILTNGKGEITDYWVGKLPPDKELEVLTKLNQGV